MHGHAQSLDLPFLGSDWDLLNSTIRSYKPCTCFPTAIPPQELPSNFSQCDFNILRTEAALILGPREMEMSSKTGHGGPVQTWDQLFGIFFEIQSAWLSLPQWWKPDMPYCMQVSTPASWRWSCVSKPLLDMWDVVMVWDIFFLLYIPHFWYDGSKNWYDGSKNGSNTLNGCVWCCPHEATGSWVGRTQCHPIAQDEAVMASRTEFGNLSACAKDILNLQKLWLPQRWWSFEDRIFLLITTCIEPPVSDGSLKKWTAGQIWQSSLFSVKVSLKKTKYLKVAR